MANPNAANINITEFLIKINQCIFFPSLNITMNSRTGGNTKASTVEQTDPIKLRSNPKFGISMATENVTRTTPILNILSPATGRLSANFHILMTDGNMISIGMKN